MPLVAMISKVTKTLMSPESENFKLVNTIPPFSHHQNTDGKVQIPPKIHALKKLWKQKIDRNPKKKPHFSH